MISLRLNLLALLPILGIPGLIAGEPASLERQGSRLDCHLTLAKEPGAYLEIGRDGVSVFVKGVEVRRLPVLKFEMPSSRKARFSRVISKKSAVTTREVVVRVEQISANPADTVSSPDEIVSVGDMPETFAIRLGDGSGFFVTGKESQGLLNGKRKEWLRFRVAWSFLIDRLLGRPSTVAFIEMEPGAARYFYWLLQADMGVIY